MIDLDVLGIRLVEPLDDPVLLLGERDGSRVLPIWISAVDAAAIAIALEEDSTPPRPLTQDVLADAIELIDELFRAMHEQTSKREVVIERIEDGIFYATLRVGALEMDVRPSDGVGVGLRLGLPLRCAAAVMDEVGVEIQEPDSDEVERFKEFLDTISADDFQS